MFLANPTAASLRKLFEFGRFAETAIEGEDSAVAGEGDAGFTGESGDLQDFPAGEVPGGKAVPVEMPGIVGILPGSDFYFQPFFERGLEGVPIAVIKKGMRQKVPLLERGRCGWMPDVEDWFEGIFGGVQEQERGAESGANVSLVGEGDDGVEEGRGAVGDHGPGTAKHIKFVGGAGHKDQGFYGGVGLKRGEQDRDAVGAVEYCGD